MQDNELQHYGVPGMKWGVIRAKRKAKQTDKLQKKALAYDKKSAKLTKKAEKAHAEALEKAKEYGLQTASVAVRGPGVGRESALRALQNSGVVVISIVDNTYYPHNGCRPPKRRRR